jgi:hypothetical protein
MKYLFATLGLLLAAAVATGVICYRMSCNPELHAVIKKGDAMEWLRTDFHLDRQQFAAIRQLHDSYAGTCGEHCRRIQEAARVKQALLAGGASDAELQAANQRLQELRLVCETAIARHVHQVATLMSPQDGQRYLALVLPKIADFDHQAAPDLHLNPTP